MYSAQGPLVRRQIGRGILAARVTIGKIIKAYDAPFATIFYNLHLATIARLEADGGSCGNVKMHAECGCAVKLQIAVHLEEMKMRSHLDGTIARIANGDGGGATPYVILYILLR